MLHGAAMGPVVVVMLRGRRRCCVVGKGDGEVAPTPTAELQLRGVRRRALFQCNRNDRQARVDLSKGCKGADPTAADPTDFPQKSVG